ncbi:hypothetical protein P775_09270 [Puniceibacterium antarcticum]|uniref:Uncharacterized protein n=1 Tax=Puniceibacterium antarcticum TaxID=1206336 RepID=A0A2G8RGJ1_9RHOB|nr:hypothetical protein P775_09270 [Puniceibacterium antarcticum]
MREGLACSLCRFFVQFDVVYRRNHFASCVVTARGADVMRALKLAAVVTFVGVPRHEGVMGATIVATRFRYFILLDGHVSTSICYEAGMAHMPNYRSVRPHNRKGLSDTTLNPDQGAKIGGKIPGASDLLRSAERVLKTLAIRNNT